LSGWRRGLLTVDALRLAKAVPAKNGRKKNSGWFHKLKWMNPFCYQYGEIDQIFQKILNKIIAAMKKGIGQKGGCDGCDPN
jgi:hypothetical protein